MSFKWKTSLLITGVVTLILLSIHSFVFFRFAQTAIGSEQKLLDLHIRQLIDDYRASPKRALNAWANDLERNQYIEVRDADGHLLFAKGLHFPEALVRSPVSGSPAAGTERKRLTAAIFAGDYRVNGNHILFAVRSVRVPLSDQLLFSVTLFENAEKVDSFINSIRRLLLFATLLGIFAAAAASFLVAGAAIRPVGNLIRRVRGMGMNELHLRLPLPKSRDEIHALTETLNDMLERVEAGVVKQQQFVADASHELRTPLAIIAGHANMLNRWGKDSPELTKESSDFIIQQTERLRRLSEQLLQTATLEQTPPEPACTDAAEAVCSLCAQAALLNPQVTLAPDIPDSPVLAAIPRAELQQAAMNVLENAMKYTPAGGQVTVSLQSVDQAVELTVADTGPGIPEADLPHIFERFYRADKARSREQGGNGLGLAIVKGIIDRCKGSLRVTSTPGSGTVFTLIFPLAADQRIHSTEESRADWSKTPSSDVSTCETGSATSSKTRPDPSSRTTP